MGAQETKVNIGCGTKAIPGWINIDISLNILLSKIPLLKWILFKLGLIPEEAYRMVWPPGTIRHDVRKGLPFKDSTVDWIYTCHFLEHVKKQEAIRILREVYRVLKPGGRIRIVAPDLKILANKYVEADAGFFGANAEKNIAEAFLESLNFFPKETFQRVCAGQIHLWMYDFESLNNMLGTCGFRNVGRENPQKSEMPDVERLEGMPSKCDLCVEAQK